MQYIETLINIFRFCEWIKVIAITGGPCAGKSTFLAMAIALLQKHGVKVIVVPEVARELISAGFYPWDASWNNSLAFQKHVFLSILEKEARYFEALSDMDLKGQKVVFLCDRGLIDNVAYMGEENFAALLGQLGVKYSSVLDRYDGVISLVTAAKGAAEHYKNDEVRKETPEEAIALDDKGIHAWSAHQHLSIIDNSTNFPDKINRALLALQRLLHIPMPQEIERKYLVQDFSLGQLSLEVKSFEISQTYLDRPDRPGIECRARKKFTEDGWSYFYTEKTLTKTEGVRGEVEDQITEVHYHELIKLYADPNCLPVEKTRYKFPYGSFVFELDVYQGKLEGLVILEVEFLNEEIMNSFVPPQEFDLLDVTADKCYSNRQLAEHGIPVS